MSPCVIPGDLQMLDEQIKIISPMVTMEIYSNIVLAQTVDVIMKIGRIAVATTLTS